MAKNRISTEDVRAAVESYEAQGRDRHADQRDSAHNITIKMIQDYFKARPEEYATQGSPLTIGAALTALRGGQPKGKAKTPTAPETLTQDITAALNKATPAIMAIIARETKAAAKATGPNLFDQDEIKNLHGQLEDALKAKAQAEAAQAKAEAEAEGLRAALSQLYQGYTAISHGQPAPAIAEEAPAKKHQGQTGKPAQDKPQKPQRGKHQDEGEAVISATTPQAKGKAKAQAAKDNAKIAALMETIKGREAATPYEPTNPSRIAGGGGSSLRLAALMISKGLVVKIPAGQGCSLATPEYAQAQGITPIN